MKRFLKVSLSVVVLALIMSMSFGVQAKTSKKSARTVYYIVCGSYSTLAEAKSHCDNMSEVVFYEAFEAKVNGKTVYRVCCDCYYNLADAKKDMNGLYRDFGGDKWIWPSKGLAKCVYRPASPRDGKPIPAFKPSTKAISD